MGQGIAQVAAAAGYAVILRDVSVEALDRGRQSIELGYNHPMGQLRLTDLVGLDVRLNIAEYLHGKSGSDVFRPPDILKRMVSEGKLGKKSGEGFYKWTEQETGQRAYTDSWLTFR